LIYEYTFKWLNGTKPISVKFSAIPRVGKQTIYLGSGAPPREATSALVTLTFVGRRTTREVLVPLNQDTKIIRAPF